MRVLGIDCGTERTGWGVIESDGRRHQVLSHGVICTVPRDPLDARLAISRALRAVIADQTPDAAAVEEVFYSQNVKTALKLAHVRGVALLAIAEAGVILGEYSPLEVKMSVVGYGRAEKQPGAAHGQDADRDWHRLRRRGGCDRGGHLPRYACFDGVGDEAGHVKALVLFVFAVAAFAEGPRIVFIKSFPGSMPAYVEISIDKSGAVSYKEAVDDDSPETFEFDAASTAQLFDLAAKLDHFSHPLESGLKVANMGMKCSAGKTATRRRK